LLRRHPLPSVEFGTLGAVSASLPLKRNTRPKLADPIFEQFAEQGTAIADPSNATICWHVR